MKRLSSLVFTLGLSITALSASGCDSDPLVHQDTPVVKAVYEDLARGWLRWAMALPHSQSPISDQTGERCAMGQDDEIWMLAGTFGGPATRDCDIPALTPLYFPLVNRWIIPGLDPTDVPEDLPGFIAWVQEYFAWQRAHTCEMTLALDGEALLADDEMDEELYVVVDEPFEVELNDDNWATMYGKQGGVYPISFIDGHWALLEPLSPGDHLLEFGAVMCDGEEILFETSATYNLHVASYFDDDDSDE